MAVSLPSPSLPSTFYGNRHRHHRRRLIHSIPHLPTLTLNPPSIATLRAPRAKFKVLATAAGDSGPAPVIDQEPDEDSDLPSDLEGAVRQSGQASGFFLNSGGTRAIVELLIPQLQFLDAEGAQGELWELSRIFLESLIEETGLQRVKAIFPDAGAAALLKYQWKDANFGFSSLSDRKPVGDEDDIVVMILPDYQMLEYVERIASRLSDDPVRPLIMWNPRLISEDVGVGFNVRNLRRYFLSTFTTVYSMRPLPTGAIFRCYPGMWKVFYDDVKRPNRYLLAKEQPRRPDATDIEIIFGDVAEKSDKPPSFLGKAMGMFTSLNKFMQAISRDVIGCEHHYNPTSVGFVRPSNALAGFVDGMSWVVSTTTIPPPSVISQLICIVWSCNWPFECSGGIR